MNNQKHHTRDDSGALAPANPASSKAGPDMALVSTHLGMKEVPFLTDIELLEQWKETKAAFFNAAMDLVKHGSFWASEQAPVGYHASKHAEAAMDLHILTLRMLDLEGPGSLRWLPAELPEISMNESCMHAQAIQKNIEQLEAHRDAIDFMLDVLSKEADLLRDKYAPRFESADGA